MSSVAPASSSLALEVSARTAEESARSTSGVTTDRPGAAQGASGSPFGKRVRIGALALVLALGGGGYLYSTRGIESTDNAQVDADVVAVPARATGVVMRVHFSENQRVTEGTLLAELDDAAARAQLAQAKANLAAAQAAQAAAVADTKLVETNAVGNRDMAAAALKVSSVGARASNDEIREGEAQLASAKTRLAQAELDLARALQLFNAGAGTRTQLDQAQTARDLAESGLGAQAARLSSLKLSQAQSQSRVVEANAKLRQSSHVDTLVEQAQARRASAEAQVAQAQAALELAEVNLSYTKIYAPQAGVLSRKSINEGQSVALGQPVVQLVPDVRWVTANFKETQLTHMQPGQAATFEVDAYPGVQLTGEIESISGATGARFALLPPDNATGNFTKVVQRVPVRVRVRDLPREVTLRPGMSVELKINTRTQG
ncbi:MAG TPA: HlyD family secretion protein [Polyangiales bacterium]